MATIMDDSRLYNKFEKSISKVGGEDWVLAVFEGSPAGSEYSWCSDCVAAKGDLRSFLADYRGPVRVVQFKVGSKDEWEGRDGGPSPFKARFPHLSDLPTAVLFHGKLDVARTIAPRREDLEYLARRAEVLQGQVQDRSWHPPKSA